MRVSILGALLLTLAPASALARPTVLPDRTLRVDFAPTDFTILNTGAIGGRRGFVVGSNAPDDPRIGMGLGLSLGLTGRAEAGILFLPLALSPDNGYGDITFHSRYRALGGSFELALQLAVQIPTDTNLGLGLGAPMIFHLGSLDIETGAELELIFSDNTVANLDIPVSFLFDINRALFFGVRTGFFFANIDNLYIPLGPVVGARIAMSGSLQLEPIAAFVFEQFVSTDGSGPIVTDVWTLQVGANLRFRL